MGENKIKTFQLAHSGWEAVKVKNKGVNDASKWTFLTVDELMALIEVFEMAIGEIVPTKAEIELYLSENEKLLTLSPDDNRFHEAIENVKAFKRDYGL